MRLNLPILFLCSLILPIGFAWAGLKKKASPAHNPEVSFPAGVGVALSFGFGAWALNFPTPFIGGPLVMMFVVQLTGIRSLRSKLLKFVTLILAFWVLFSIYPFGEIALDFRFIGYIILLLFYFHKQVLVYTQPDEVPGLKIGSVALGLLLIGYYAFEHHRSFPLVWLPLLLSAALFSVLPFGLAKVSLGRSTWALLGFISSALILKVTHNLTDFLALHIAFFPLYMGMIVRRSTQKAGPAHSLAGLWVHAARWEPNLVAGGFWVAQFFLGLFALGMTTFGLKTMIGLVLLLFFLAKRLSDREYRRLSSGQ